MQDSILKAPSLFEKAEKIVTNCRHIDYGSPSAMCEYIADMWNAYLSLKDKNRITSKQEMVEKGV